ncbi:hypothetical protein EGK75_04570 [Neisseria weixii]|nr:hypothetical protein EGK75_04570 [Neisseria weixii]
MFELPKGSEFEPAAKILRSEGGSPQRANLQLRPPFFCLLFFGEAKKSRWQRGHEAQTLK